MDDEQQNQASTISIMLAEAGIPVPVEEIGKIEQLHRTSGEARQALRALRLMETEPVTILVPGDAGTDAEGE